MHMVIVAKRFACAVCWWEYFGVNYQTTQIMPTHFFEVPLKFIARQHIFARLGYRLLSESEGGYNAV